MISAVMLFFMGGIWIGTKIDMEEFEKENNYNRSIKNTVAVVNLDLGIGAGDENVNYSEAFISSLSGEYRVVSYMEAQDGFDKGEFSAIVTFPSSLSESVNSLNESDLQSPKIEFSINPALTENLYIESYLKMLDLQNDINKSISYLYVTSVFDELHDAQDKVRKVFVNDEADMEALSAVQMQDFRESVDWSSVPDVEFTPTEIDFDDFMAQVQGYADHMANEYIQSYAVAQRDYADFQALFSAQTQNISSYGMSWYNEVDARERNITDYTAVMKEYRGDLLQWGGNVEKYNNDTEAWRTDVSSYLGELNMWKAAATDWKSNVETWSSKYKEELDKYSGSVDKYLSAVETYENELSLSYETDAKKWAEDYVNYYNETEQWKQSMDSLVETCDIAIENLKKYLPLAVDYASRVGDYRESMENRLEFLQGELYSTYFENVKKYETLFRTGYWGEEEDSGLEGDVEKYYSAVKEYENEITVYKEDIESYRLAYENALTEYKESLDKYVEDYIKSLKLENEGFYSENGITQEANYPEFNISEVPVIFGDKEVPEVNLESNKSDIEKKISALEQERISYEDVQEKLKSDLEDQFAEYSEKTKTGIPEPQYPVLPNSEDIADIDKGPLKSYAPTELKSWEDTNDVEAPASKNYVENNISESTSTPPGKVSNFERTNPEFSGQEYTGFGRETPAEVEDTLPSVPNEFIEACEAIISESQKYSPENYLSSEVQARANAVLEGYAGHLTTADLRLKSNTQTNIDMLREVHKDYNEYVSELRADAQEAYTDQNEGLELTLEEFYKVKSATSGENKELLKAFTQKLPNSRENALINRELVNFMISPVEFTSSAIRISETTAKTTALSRQERLDIYYVGVLATLALVVLSVMFVMIVYWKEALSKKKEER